MYKIGKLGWKSIINTCFIPYYNLYGSPGQIWHFLKKILPPVWRHFVQKVGRGFLRYFLNFSCAHKHSRQSSYKNLRKTKGIYRKTRKPLGRERSSSHQILKLKFSLYVLALCLVAKTCHFISFAHN